jgi:hypothetical protein
MDVWYATEDGRLVNLAHASEISIVHHGQWNVVARSSPEAWEIVLGSFLSEDAARREIDRVAAWAHKSGHLLRYPGPSNG